MPIARLSILGVGLMGGSVGLAVRKHLNSCRVVGYGHKSDTLNQAIRIGAIHEATTDLAAAVRDADLILLAAPVGQLPELLTSIFSHVKQDAVITDVGSTKRSIVSAADRILPPHVRGRLIGAHPMAGGEKAGVAHASADLLDDALCILTPTPQTDPQSLDLVDAFWRAIGMRTTRMGPADHDRLVAAASHLPHLLAVALMATQSDESLDVAGRGLLDMTRLAAGDGALWRDIFLDNADNLREALSHFRRRLDEIAPLLDPAKTEQLKDYLDRIATQRQSFNSKSEEEP
jgi:prephenate dehydrogenase